jgi:hypothetical protein
MIIIRVFIFLYSQKYIPPERYMVLNATPYFYHVVGGAGPSGREQEMISAYIVILLWFLRVRFISIIVAYVQIDGRRTSRFRHGIIFAVVCCRLSMVYLSI